MTTEACNICDETTDDLLAHLKERHPEAVKTAAEVPPPARPRPPFVEGKPWDRYVRWVDESGEPTTHHNPSSYAYLAAVSCAEWACELLDRHQREVAAETGKAHFPPSRGQILGLARSLIEAADEAQKTLRPDGAVDRMASSHTRARGAVRSALWMHPVPWGAPENVKKEWIASLTGFAVDLLECGLDLL